MPVLVSSDVETLLEENEGVFAASGSFRRFRVFGVAGGLLALVAVAARWSGSGPFGMQALETDGKSTLIELALAEGCTLNGHDCRQSKCCEEPGMTCYSKNEHWASCNKTCDPYMMWVEEKGGWEKQDVKVWNCDELSKPPACSTNGRSCSTSKCCANPASKCYRKNEHWASCNATCSHNMQWDTDAGGWREQTKHIWDCDVMSCALNGENCSYSKCCEEPGMTCYKKNDHWSSCNKTCNHYMMWVDNGWQKQEEKVWDCDVLSLED